MKLKPNSLIIVILIIVVIAYIVIKNPSDQEEKSSNPESTIQSKAVKKLPKLIDLGKGTCIPCKKMKPILDELKMEYQGKAIVEVIDLRYDRGASLRYRIRLIPTQIFYNAEGNEVYRHEGFMDKQSIIQKFVEMGVD